MGTVPLARRLGAGAVAGVVAWVVGLAFTLLVLWTVGVDATERGPSAEFEVAAVDRLSLLGLVYFGAHLVGSRVQPPVTDGVNFVTVLAEAVDPTYRVLFLVPPLVLAVAGGVVSALDDRPFDGPLIAVGYLPASLLAATLSRVEVDAGVSVTVWVPTTPAAVVAGAAYPLVLGLLGGAVARLVP